VKLTTTDRVAAAVAPLVLVTSAWLVKIVPSGGASVTGLTFHTGRTVRLCPTAKSPSSHWIVPARGTKAKTKPAICRNRRHEIRIHVLQNNPGQRHCPLVGHRIRVGEQLS
jgi:hypothetical protein